MKHKTRLGDQNKMENDMVTPPGYSSSRFFKYPPAQ